LWYLPVAAITIPVVLIIAMAGTNLSLGTSMQSMGIEMSSATYLISLGAVLSAAFLIRYRERELQYDFVSAVAFIQLFILGASGELDFSSIVFTARYSTLTVLVLLAVLTAGLPLRMRRNRMPGHLMILWAVVPTLVTAILLFSAENTLHGGMSLLLTGTMIDIVIPVMGTAISLILIMYLSKVQFKPFRDSFAGFVVFLMFLATGLLLSAVPHTEMDETWWISNAIIWLSPLFVAWGLSSDRRAYVEGTVLSRQLLDNTVNATSESTRGKTPGNLSEVVVSAIASTLQGAGSFEYGSTDGIHWTLECEISTFGKEIEPMPSAFDLDLRTELLDKSNFFVSSSEPTPLAAYLRKVSVLPSAGVMVNAHRDRFFFIGVREKDRLWWEEHEISMLKTIATGIGLSEYQSEMTATNAVMVVRLLSIIHAAEKFFSISGAEELYSVATELVASELGFENVSLWAIEEKTHLSLRSFVWRGRKDKELNRNDKIPLTSGGVLSAVASSGKSMLVSDVTIEPAYLDLIKSDTVSEYATPVLLDGALVSVLDVQSDTKNGFDQLDTRVIDTVAALLSAALEAQRLSVLLDERASLSETRADLVSHDLKNILQPMRLYLQLLREDILGGKNNATKDLEHISAIEKSVDAAIGLLANVLKIFKVAATKEQSLEACDLANVLEASSTLIKQNFTGRAIDFRFTRVEHGLTIKANKLIGEVFSNLFSNSIKYCNRPEAIIEVSAEILNGGGQDIVQVLVSDNGAGITPERQLKIFERFDTGAGGTGLGLSLVKEIMKNIGGTIEAREKIPGDYKQGTTFVLKFQFHHIPDNP
jgi:signal transduction histidine kinase